MEIDFNYGVRWWRVINVVYFAKVIWHSDVWIMVKYTVWYFLEGHKEPVICNLSYLNVRTYLGQFLDF